MLNITARSGVLLAALASATITSACSKQGKPPLTTADRAERARGEMKASDSIVATVVSVNLEQNTVVLHDMFGRRFAIEADPRAAAALKPEDTVNAVYRESLAFALVPPPVEAPAQRDDSQEQCKPETEVEELAQLKVEGSVQLGRRITATVHILAVAPGGTAVDFRVPEGGVRKVAIREPQHQREVANLRPGDSVDVTYTERLVIEEIPGGSL